ncbi:MAG: YfhO family protein, partial [Planctomycetes bacterium]|nr:YfhO family protein [Planctomycetota bacterium]
EHHFVLTKNDFAVPRARLVAGIEIEPDDARAIERLRDPAFPMAMRAILADGKPRDDGIGDVGTARIVSTDPDHLVIDVDVKREAYLVLADTDFPGWRARVDGHERRIERANVAFRAVALRRGDKRVEFAYEPKSVLYGGLGSALSALVWLGLCFGAGRRWLTLEA